MNRFLLNLLFCWQAFSLTAQTNKGITDSVFQIRELTVLSNRLEYFSIGNKIRTVDSSLLGSYATANLAQVLGSYSQVQINSYGLGLSNPSIRGTGTSHTAVLWNGFNLQDLLNGGVDCSLLPINFFDDVTVQYGGCSALYGSGAIGGAIHLSNQTDFDKGFSSSIYSGYGSFENMFGGLNLGYSNSIYSGFVKSFWSGAMNDFEFKNTTVFGSPVQTLQNANRNQYGVLTGNSLKLSSSSKLESYFWFQDNNKGIAPTMLSYSNSKQRDKSFRTTMSWKTWNDNSDFTMRTYFSNYYMKYDADDFRSITLTNEAEYNVKITNNHLINAGLDYTFEKASAKSLISDAHRHRIALLTSYRFTSNQSNWKLALNIRNEVIDHNLSPVTFSLGLEKKITQFLMAKGMLSRNYRLPTFDDLYWASGGNPDLKSELGLNKEISLVATPGIGLVHVRLESSWFMNHVSNWILWQPLNSGIWQPVNVNKVYARGLENELSISFPVNTLLLKTTFAYTYTKSTKENEDYEGDPAFNKQLIYVPTHKGLVSFTAIYKGFTLYCAQSYAGKRYTRTDNTKSVSPYTLGNVSISKKVTIRNQALDVALQLNNIWNTSYQVMEYYPMPLRNFQLNIRFTIK